jgi:hypothetical protein
MEDLKQIQEFFSKPLEEKKLTYNDFVRMVRDDMMAGSSPDDHISDEQVRKRAKSYYNEYLKGTSVDDLFEADVPVSEDIPDIIAVDVPLFIRLLEFAREDAGDDMDLHEVAERAIEAVKARGVLSMDDYDTLVPPKEELDEKMLVPTDKIERMARDIAAKYFSSKTDKKPAIDILKKAIEDSYKALDPEVEIREEEGYSPQLVSPENPKGKTQGLDSETMSKILMKIMQDIEETKQLGENLNEELCPKGKAYIKKRMAAGEKSSAYLSGRAVKVCKGQMER